MQRYVLDASAILALVKKEQGAEIVRQHIKGAIMSSVNYSEVISVLARKMPQELIITLLSNLIHEIVPFDEKQALEAGLLYSKTSKCGLSLGDRACIVLATFRRLPILTADSIWAKLELDIEIKNIRPSYFR